MLNGLAVARVSQPARIPGRIGMGIFTMSSKKQKQSQPVAAVNLRGHGYAETLIDNALVALLERGSAVSMTKLAEAVHSAIIKRVGAEQAPSVTKIEADIHYQQRPSARGFVVKAGKLADYSPRTKRSDAAAHAAALWAGKRATRAASKPASKRASKPSKPSKQAVVDSTTDQAAS